MQHIKSERGAQQFQHGGFEAENRRQANIDRMMITTDPSSEDSGYMNIQNTDPRTGVNRGRLFREFKVAWVPEHFQVLNLGWNVRFVKPTRGDLQALTA